MTKTLGVAAVLVATISTAVVLVVGHAPPRMADVPVQYAGLTSTQDYLVADAIKYGPMASCVYRWAGESPIYGFDCSGFTQYVYAQVGISIPRDSRGQYAHGLVVPIGQERPGDLVFFHGGTGGVNAGPPPGHVGIYIGGGKFVEYYQTGYHARISVLASASGYMGARRYGWNPVQVPAQFLGKADAIAARFHELIYGTVDRTVVIYEPKSAKLLKWAKAQRYPAATVGNETRVGMVARPVKTYPVRIKRKGWAGPWHRW